MIILNIALITAAGNGTRMGQDIPKQFMPIGNKPLIVHTLEKFQAHPEIDAILIVTLPAWIEVLRAYAEQYGIGKLRWIVPGGASNQESIYNGLVELKLCCKMGDVVMIHDGNRCSISQDIITESFRVFRMHGDAVAAIPCVDAVFLSEDNQTASSFIPREKVMRTQTPHTYTLEKLLWAHEEARKRGIENTTATCTLMSLLGEEIHFSKGSEENFKLTTVEDVKLFRALLSMTGTETGWKDKTPENGWGGARTLVKCISLRRMGVA